MTQMTILERFALLELLPKEGNFITLKIIRLLRERLALSEEEIKEYGIQRDGEQLSWNPEMNHVQKEIEISDLAKEIIVANLKRLDDQQKLADNQFSLFEKFCSANAEKAKVN